jgi:versiconal hemiacetal acetate esterase
VFWGFECPAPGGDSVADVVAGIRIFTHTWQIIAAQD